MFLLSSALIVKGVFSILSNLYPLSAAVLKSEFFITVLTFTAFSDFLVYLAFSSF